MKKHGNIIIFIKKLKDINNILTELLIQAEEEHEYFEIANSLLKIKRQTNKALYELKAQNDKNRQK